jgi:multiple sugar transport system ATP-binding protein
MLQFTSSGAASIGLRPEHIHVGEGYEAHAVRVEHLGDQTRLHLKLNDLDLITLTEAHTHIQSGDCLRIAPQSPLYFDANGERIKS